jgi:hypothetical protein
MLTDPQPLNAVEAILAAFDKFPIVALGEAHGLQEEANFIASLIRHPDFPHKVNAIVVEVGNAKYQPLVDKYITEESVDSTELCKVWRDLTVILTGDAPIYEQFYSTVRAVNQSLPVEKRLRVLLGEPPIDWSKIHKREEHEYWLAQRDKHFAEVVEKEVFAKGFRALIICGSAHLDRGPGPSAPPPIPGSAIVMRPFPDKGIAPTLKPDLNMGVMLQFVERRHPGSTFVIETHLGFGNRNAELEPRLSSWPKPSIALIKGTWLGALDAGFTSVSDVFITPDGNRVNPAQGRRKEDVADAYLYLGPVDSLTMSHPSPKLYLDEAYFRELNRRHIIMTGQPLNLAELTKEKPKKYIDNFN